MGKAQIFSKRCHRASFSSEIAARVVLLTFGAQLLAVLPLPSPTSDQNTDFGFAWITSAHATGSPAPSNDPLASVDPGFNPTMPPQFNTAAIAGQGQLFQNCNGQLQASLQQGLQAVGSSINGLTSRDPLAGNQAGLQSGALGFGINAVCPGTDVGPSAESLTCEAVQLPDGSLNMTLLREKAMALDLALANIQCRKGKFAAVQGELSCLTSQADMLTQQLTAVQGAYQTNIQRMQQDVQKINQVVQDRQSQDADVLQRLNGSTGSENAPGNGSHGLIGIRDGLCQALTGAPCGSSPTGGGGGSGGESIPAQIQTLKNKMTDAATQEKSLTEAIAERTMGIAGDCFNNRKQPSYQCVVNGPPVTAHEYVLCMYQQKLGVNPDGQVESSALSQGGMLANQNSAKAQALSAMLDTIMGDIPQKTQAGPNGQAPDPSQIQAATILTAADVEAQYGAKLAEYDTASTPIHDFVMRNIGACFQRAEKVVRQEKNMASSPIGQQQSALKKAKEDLKVQANVMLSSNVAKYEEAMTALTGVSMPLNTSKCNNGTPETQVACLQDLQSNMDSLLRGSAKQSTIQMLIQGTDARTNISFTCQGLNGCITALQNVDRNLRSEVRRLQTFKTQYVTAAKAQVDNFTKQMAAMMSSQSAALTNKLKSLNTALASLGVSGGGITIPKVECEPANDDPDGVPRVPSSALKAIGCKMNPPMLDVSGNDFSSALSSVAQGSRELDAKIGPLNSARNVLSTLPNTCRGKQVQALAQVAQRDTDQLASGNCQYSDQFCGATTSPVSSLGNTLTNVDGMGIASEAIGNIESSLNQGLASCQTASARQMRTYRACIANGGQAGVPSPLPASTGGPLTFPLVSGGVTYCGSTNSGGVEPSPTCASIQTRLQRDIANIGRAGGGGGGTAAGGAN